MPDPDWACAALAGGTTSPGGRKADGGAEQPMNMDDQAWWHGETRVVDHATHLFFQSSEMVLGAAMVPDVSLSAQSMVAP